MAGKPRETVTFLLDKPLCSACQKNPLGVTARGCFPALASGVFCFEQPRNNRPQAANGGPISASMPADILFKKVRQ